MPRICWDCTCLFMLLNEINLLFRINVMLAMLSSTWPILSISSRFIRWENYSVDEVLLHWCNYGYFGLWSTCMACQIRTLIKYPAWTLMCYPEPFCHPFQTFNGKKWEKFNSEKVASLAYARIQGKTALIAHFQNSSLMNEDKRCRPILFHSEGPNAGDQVCLCLFFFLGSFPAILFSSSPVTLCIADSLPCDKSSLYHLSLCAKKKGVR